jgi:hypothetical protein
MPETRVIMETPPAITHILETALMVKDVAASTGFYKTVLNVEPFLDNV